MMISTAMLNYQRVDLHWKAQENLLPTNEEVYSDDSDLGHLDRNFHRIPLHPGIEGTEEVRTQDATAAFTQEKEVETRIATETRERPGGSDRWGGFFYVSCWMSVKDFKLRYCISSTM